MITKEQIEAEAIKYDGNEKIPYNIAYIFEAGANFVISQSSDLLEEVKMLRDEYIKKAMNQKYQSIIHPIEHYFLEMTDRLTQIINKAEQL